MTRYGMNAPWTIKNWDTFGCSFPAKKPNQHNTVSSYLNGGYINILNPKKYALIL